MKTPDEIKNGLNHCSEDGCKQCPYKDDCDMADGFSVLAGDANAYIQQLENKICELTEKVEQLEEAHVVRCRDCEFWAGTQDSLQGKCLLTGEYPTGAWYCANGRIKEAE